MLKNKTKQEIICNYASYLTYKKQNLMESNWKDDRSKSKITIIILNTNSLNIHVNGRDSQNELKINTYCILSLRNSFLV